MLNAAVQLVTSLAIILEMLEADKFLSNLHIPVHGHVCLMLNVRLTVKYYSDCTGSWCTRCNKSVIFTMVGYLTLHRSPFNAWWWLLEIPYIGVRLMHGDDF